MQIGTSLITIPLTLKYLGNERFGLWMTISSVLAVASFADFGVGNGVLNTVAEAFGRDDMNGVRRALSSGFAVLSSIAAFLLLAFFSVYRFIDWGSFFGVVSARARSEAGPALSVFATCFALNIALDVVQRVQLGLQEGYRYSIWQLGGSLLGFAGVLSGIWLHVSLPVLVAAVAGAPIVSTVLNTIVFFGFLRPELRPSAKFVSRAAIQKITRLGGLFFILQLVVAASFSGDNFIIARMIGAVNVPEYSIPQRMFALPGVLLTTLLAPLWPAYGEAISRKDILWVRRTLRRSLVGAVGLSFLSSCVLLALAPRLLHWWVGSRIHPPFALLLGLAIWAVMEAGSNALGAFLNGSAAVTFQIWVSVAFGAVCLAVKIFLIRRFGFVALPWSTILTCLAVQVIPWTVFIPRFLERLQSRSASTAELGSRFPIASAFNAIAKPSGK